jgi:hypothetical protein
VASAFRRISAYAAADTVTLTIGGVAVPVASPATLIRTKNTLRPSDAADRNTWKNWYAPNADAPENGPVTA